MDFFLKIKAFCGTGTLLLLACSGGLAAEDVRLRALDKSDVQALQACRIARPGDLAVSDGETLFLIGDSSRDLKSITLSTNTSDARGSIIGLLPAGDGVRGELNIGAPRFKHGAKTVYLTYDSVNALDDRDGDKSIRVLARAGYDQPGGIKAEVETTYRFLPGRGRVDISSNITNTGSAEIEGFRYWLHFDARHRYFFSPHSRERYPDLNFRVYQKKGHSIGWMETGGMESPDDPTPDTLSPGEGRTVSYSLLAAADGCELLRTIYSLEGRTIESASLRLEPGSIGLMEVVVSDPVSSTVLYRSFQTGPGNLVVPLPAGLYKIEGHFFPAVTEQILEVAPGQANACVLREPPQGTVRLRIRNSAGDPVYGKVTVMGIDPTRTPYFLPENPVESGRAWETAKNSLYPAAEGLEQALPAGTYVLHCSRGPEYSLDRRIIEIIEETDYDLSFEIDRVVNTDGLISMDPHVHTTNSDGRVGIPERLRSVAAEGLDVVVSADHNFVTDYGPSLRDLGLNRDLAVIVGNEVTRAGLIHYNTYALPVRSGEFNNGIIDPHADEAATLFERSREKDPAAIIQVNHPRSGTIGYFNTYDLDKKTGLPGRKSFDTSFHVLEVMNGPCLFRIGTGNDESIEDWLHLLNRGFYFPHVGSSDSHLTDQKEPGYARTYVEYDGPAGDQLDWPAVASAIRKGRSFTSNGPIIRFSVNDGCRTGDLTTAKDGRVELSIKVESAPWVSVDEVRVIINGERKIIRSVQTAGTALTKLEERISVELERDASIVVEAFGGRTLFPVLQIAHWGYTNGTFPYALTNPVFVDVDGNGRFDPPWPRGIEEE